MSLIHVTEAEFGVELDMKYATADNFTARAVYARPSCYLHADAVACLEVAIRLAAEQGWRLRIFDAFRPSAVQFVFWAHTPDPEFLCDPNKGSPHSRGVAVDLTLVDIASGEALDMGTGFDAFTPRSHHGNIDISNEAQLNRLKLMGLMTTAGWDFYRNEWWHYQLFDAKRYALLDDEALDTPLSIGA